MKYYLKLTNNDEYIIMGVYDTRECAELLLDWHERHRKFFNGVFEIEEV